MSLKGSKIINRYIINELIGEGGMSQVYSAIDVETDNKVAVKLMKKIVTSNYLEDHIRFKREIEIVSSFVHSNIARVYNSGDFDNKLFIIMEFLEGNNLSDLLNRGFKFGIEETLKIIKQLLETLIYVHGKGVIHRDLKPANIMLNEKGTGFEIKLLDFGLAHIMDLWEIKDISVIAGTFGYMSPESAGILKRSIDERCDLYSVGVILYHMLTGELPYKGKDIGSILHQQAATMPIPPSNINKNIPESLNGVVIKLLMKDPDSRYQSARGVLYDIERILDNDKEFIPGEKDQKEKITYQTTIIAREEEIKKIEELYENACLGKGSICFVSGEAGVGKSRLSEEIREFVFKKRGLFIDGKCLNYENKTPYQPFHDALEVYICGLEKIDDVMRGKTVLKLTETLGELGEVLVRLNPSIKKIIGEQKQLLTLDSDKENQRFLMVLSKFFCNIIEKGSACVIYLDDLHWSDEGSIHLLYEIIKKIRKSNLLIIGTFRSNEINQDHVLSLLLDEIKENKYSFEEIKLNPFSIDETKKLLTNLLGQEDKKLSELSEVVFKKSEGNPLFSINILRELIEQQAVIWRAGHWEEDWVKINNIPVSESMVDVILRRLEGLDVKLREFLCKAT